MTWSHWSLMSPDFTRLSDSTLVLERLATGLNGKHTSVVLCPFLIGPPTSLCPNTRHIDSGQNGVQYATCLWSRRTVPSLLCGKRVWHRCSVHFQAKQANALRNQCLESLCHDPQVYATSFIPSIVVLAYPTTT